MKADKYGVLRTMKTKEELTALKAEVEALTSKLNELTEVELKIVTGGAPEYDELLANSNLGRGKNGNPTL